MSCTSAGPRCCVVGEERGVGALSGVSSLLRGAVVIVLRPDGAPERRLVDMVVSGPVESPAARPRANEQLCWI